MHEDFEKRMDRLEGMAHSLKKLAMDKAPRLKDMEHQLSAAWMALYAKPKSPCFEPS